MLNLAAIIIGFISLEIFDVLFLSSGILGFRYFFEDFTPPDIAVPPTWFDLFLFGLVDPLLFQPFALISAAIALAVTLKAFHKADPPLVTLGVFILVIGHVLSSPWIFPGSDFKVLLTKLPAWLLGLTIVGLRFSKDLTPLRALLSTSSKGTALLWLIMTTSIASSFEIKPLEVDPTLQTFEERRQQLLEEGKLGQMPPEAEEEDAIEDDNADQ